MTGAPIIAVAGQPRSGTSLLMQMLAAGGVPIAPGSSWPAFEDERVRGLPADAAWLDEARGRAVKLLDPHRWSPPFDGRYAYDAIIVQRQDLDEQAKSFGKFLRATTPLPVSRRDEKRAIAGFLEGRKRIATLPWDRSLRLNFEQLVTVPSWCAGRIESFLGTPLDRDAMVAAVRQRPVTCLPYMLELELSRDEAPAP